MNIQDEHGYLVSQMHQINSHYQDIEEALEVLKDPQTDPRKSEAALDTIAEANKAIGEITQEWV